MGYILVVDDDPEVLGTIWRALNREGYEVVLANSVSQAREHINRSIPDLLILDIIMPQQSGLEFCEELRQNDTYNGMPILFLSAKIATNDIVRGLDIGGDDYLTKPFELKILSARVRALLRRMIPVEHTDATISAGNLTLDHNTYRVSTPDKHNIQLTSTEFRLLRYLMSKPDHAHSVHDLLGHIWQYPSGAGDPDLVRSHIRNLRAKIELDSSNPEHIHTIHGVGYMVRA